MTKQEAREIFLAALSQPRMPLYLHTIRNAIGNDELHWEVKAELLAEGAIEWKQIPSGKGNRKIRKLCRN